MIVSTLVLVLAAAPLTLDEVRTASRQNVDALRAELDVTRAQSGEKTTNDKVNDPASWRGVRGRDVAWRARERRRGAARRASRRA